MDTYKVGEVAILVNLRYPPEEVTVESDYSPKVRWSDCAETKVAPCYYVRAADGKLFAPDACDLRKKPTLGEDRHPARWDQCQWQPERIRG